MPEFSMERPAFNPRSLFVAVTTPFYPSGDIDYDSMINHLIYLNDCGIPGIFLAGTTGEFSALTFDERCTLLAVARETFEGQIVFNVSSPSLRESLAYIKAAQEEDMDAITALPPYYLANAPREGVQEFLSTLIESSELPLVLYHFPRHTGNDLSPAMAEELGAVALKDSAKDFDRVTSYANYLCGGDSSMIDLFERGAQGVVSVQGNYRPREIVSLYNSIGTGDANVTLQEEVASISAALRTQNQIAAIKEAISQQIQEYPTTVRLPLVPLNTEEKQHIQALNL